jgi:predicted DNA-binding transcriptional regulator AlpA
VDRPLELDELEAQLLGMTEVAEVLGLHSRTAVIVARRRHPDFPEPIVDEHRCQLWLRADIEAWARRPLA